MVLIVFALSTNLLYAQKLTSKKIQGEYQMIIPEDMSLKEAKSVAITQAKIEALKSAFGEVVIQGNSTYLSSSNSNERADSKQLFNMIAESYVNGEWIRDREPPKITTEQIKDAQEMWIRVKVKGFGRPLPERELSFEYDLSSNKSPSTKAFKHGEDFYASFKSSRSGFLYLFMDDLETQTTSLIFPLDQEITGVQSDNFIEANSKVDLFRNSSDKAPYEIGAYSSSSTEIETIKVYFLFSPNTPLLLPDSSKDMVQEEIVVDEYTILPMASMPMNKFQAWLHSLRRKNEDLEYDWSIITIE